MELKLFGTTEMRSSDGLLAHSFLSGKKRLALLVYLILNHDKGFQRRDHLLGLFWPNLSQKEARNSLSNMLWHIRKDMGKDVLLNRGHDEVMINIDFVKCDVVEFRHLASSSEFEAAINIYGGPFMQGFFLSNASEEFDEWMENQRSQLSACFLDCLDKKANHCISAGNLDEAAELLKLKIQENPFDTSAVITLVDALNKSGKDWDGKKYAQIHAEVMEKEFGNDSDTTFNKILNETQQEEQIPVQDSESKVTQDFGIAVLPFEEIGSGTEISIFSSGLHHDILTGLSTNSNLKVISRTSVLQFKQPQKSMPEIASELGVSTIVEGGVQLVNGHLRVHVQIIRAKNDNHGLAEAYDRILNSENFLEVQTELSGKITDTINTYFKLKSTSVQVTPTEKPEAFRFFHLGKWEQDKRTEEGIRKAIDLFTKALDLDKDFALAWLGLSDALSLYFDYGFGKAEDCLPQAELAIYKALAIDPDLPSAYTSLGLFQSNSKRYAEGIESFHKAIELNPSCAEAYNWLSWNSQTIGQAEKALDFAKCAVELNPLFPEAVSNLSFSYLQNGLFNEALLEADRTLDLEPNWTTGHFYKGLAHYEIGEFGLAAEVFTDLQVPWAGNGPLASWALCLLELGDEDRFTQALKMLEAKGNYYAVGLLKIAQGNEKEGLEFWDREQTWDYWSSISFFSLYPKVLSKIRSRPEARKYKEKIYEAWGYR